LFFDRRHSTRNLLLRFRWQSGEYCGINALRSLYGCGLLSGLLGLRGGGVCRNLFRALECTIGVARAGISRWRVRNGRPFPRP
jgi:hypothetical protein